MNDVILVTGGAGFIGSCFIRHILKTEEVSIVNLDALTYAGNPENLKSIEKNPKYTFVHGSIQDAKLVKSICEKYNVNSIINFAAESHVDRSIMNAHPFIETNALGTLVLLETVNELKLKLMLHVSTDEVYGTLGKSGKFTEITPIAPNSPYSASKASSDLLVNAFVNTFGTPALITRCSNNYGPYQFPEKLIPLMILNALEDKPLPVYGDGLNVRDWIHVQDHCEAIWTVYKNGEQGQVYNIGGNCELTNVDVVKTILDHLNKPDSLINFIKDRPGHDRRYAMDIEKISYELDWEPRYNFELGIEETIKWYIDNPNWCNNVRTGAYRDYYKKQYGEI
ncbi:MAG: dTDP-glucose 4,6-dehydratase [Ignavibacteriae bacterium]|nr:dTDP-glucose 4,6-dehydratase [Ignavibacteriota bacterium]